MHMFGVGQICPLPFPNHGLFVCAYAWFTYTCDDFALTGPLPLQQRWTSAYQIKTKACFVFIDWNQRGRLHISFFGCHGPGRVQNNGDTGRIPGMRSGFLQCVSVFWYAVFIRSHMRLWLHCIVRTQALQIYPDTPSECLMIQAAAEASFHKSGVFVHYPHRKTSFRFLF